MENLNKQKRFTYDSFNMRYSRKLQGYGINTVFKNFQPSTLISYGQISLDVNYICALFQCFSNERYLTEKNKKLSKTFTKCP